MADHRSRKPAPPAGSTAAFVLAVLSLLTLLQSLPAAALDATAQAQARSLGDMFAELALDPRQSSYLLQSGQISDAAYKERLRRDQAELPRLQQALARLTGEQQTLARQEAAATYDHGFADLQRQITDWIRRGRPRGRQSAGENASQAYAAPPPYVPPAPYVPPRHSNVFTRFLVMVLIGCGVGGAVVLIARRRGKASPALPADVEQVPPRSFSLPPAPPIASAPAAAAALPAEPAPLPVLPASGSVMPKPIATVTAIPVTGDAKERLLAEQTAKYQATLTAATDELMTIQAALEERKTVPGLIDKDLGRVGTVDV